jgi:hypothetical protein
MSDSLVTMISKIQAAVGDNGTIFSTTTCTAAARAALDEFNAAAPVHSTALVDVVDGQKEYNLANDCSGLLEVVDVLRQGEDEEDESLDFDAYTDETLPCIRLRAPETSGYLIVVYTQPHTVSGLDGAVESTIPVAWNQAMVSGGVMHACRIRAASRAEVVVLDKNTIARYLQIAEIHQALFYAYLARAGRQHAPRGNVDTRAWGLDTRGGF